MQSVSHLLLQERKKGVQDGILLLLFVKEKKKVFICFTCVFIKKITYTKTPGDSVLMVTCTS